MDNVEKPSNEPVNISFSIESILSRPDRVEKRRELYCMDTYENNHVLFNGTSNINKNNNNHEESKQNNCNNYYYFDDEKERSELTFSAEQIKALETEFKRGKYLSASKRTSLAKSLHLPEFQINLWFQYRRLKWKRKNTSDVETLALHAQSVPMQPMIMNNIPPSYQRPSMLARLHPEVVKLLQKRPLVSLHPLQSFGPNQGFNMNSPAHPFMGKSIRNGMSSNPHPQKPPEDFPLTYPTTSSASNNTDALAHLERDFGPNSSILRSILTFQPSDFIDLYCEKTDDETDDE